MLKFTGQQRRSVRDWRRTWSCDTEPVTSFPRSRRRPIGDETRRHQWLVSHEPEPREAARKFCPDSGANRAHTLLNYEKLILQQRKIRHRLTS